MDANINQREEVHGKVVQVWDMVMRQSNAIIHQANYLGFMLIEVIPDPNIHQMLAVLKVYDDLIDMVISRDDFSELGHDHCRLIFNAKEQISRMQKVAFALKSNDEELFNLAIKQLEGQTQF